MFFIPFKNNQQKQSALLIAIISLIFFFPYFYWWDNSYITIHDNLDSDIVWFKIIAESGKIFHFSNNSVVDNFMNGIPRNSLPPALNIITLLFFLFSPFVAYLINFLLIHIIGFIGMNLLLKSYVFKNDDEKLFRTSISLSFALLPFWGLHPGLAISGLPLVAWCLLNLYFRTQSGYHYIILILFGFYSSLIYTGVFLIIIITLIWMYLTLIKKQKCLTLLVGVMLLSFTYLFAELNLIIQFFSKNYLSHRTDWLIEGFGFKDSIITSLKIFFLGQYHAPSLNSPIIIFSVLLGLLIAFSNKNRIRTSDPLFTSYFNLFFSVIFLIIIISIIYGFWSYKSIADLRDEFFILKSLQWNRFHWLLPFFWYVAFFLSLKIIWMGRSSTKARKSILILTLLQVILVLSLNKELQKNYFRFIKPDKISTPTFRQFYDTKLFAEINEYIGKPQGEYRIISVGLFPDIAAFNGYYILDSYQRNYPLQYKQSFRKIINNELNKNSDIKNYFDNWGSRCYAFSSELGTNYLYRKDNNVIIKNFDIDCLAFKNMGGKYILSSVEINVSNNPRLLLLNIFSHVDSFYKIYLYLVK